MPPFIISITGAHSGCGKTRAAEAIIRAMDVRCGAVKYTRADLYSSLVDDDSLIGQEGKDTARLRQAGAEEVLWVQSTTEDLKELTGMALDRLAGCDLIVMEGNGPARIITPDILIFVFGDDPWHVKESARELVSRADIIIHGERPSIKTGAKMYNRYSGEEMAELVDYLGKLVSHRKGEAHG